MIVGRRFEMYSRDGDSAVERIVHEVECAVRPDWHGRIASIEVVREVVVRGIRRVAHDYPEVHDTAVREAMSGEIEKAIVGAGYHPDRFFEAVNA